MLYFCIFYYFKTEQMLDKQWLTDDSQNSMAPNNFQLLEETIITKMMVF